jgi:homoserine kinase
VIATPALALETKRARAALPAAVPMGDAVFNVQRIAMLLLAVQHADSDLLRAAMDDRLHQPHRAPLVPGLREALAWREPGLLGTFLSGAGPSIAAIVDLEVAGIHERVEQRFRDLYQRLDLDVTVRTLAARPPVAPALR